MNKRVKILSIIIIVLLGVAIVNWVNFLRPDFLRLKKTTKKEMNYNVFPFTPTSFFKKHIFPQKVSSFVNTFAKPDDTYVDVNEGCPIGQLHNWHLKDLNIELLVLGDCYKKEIDYSAGSRLYAVRKIDDNAITSFEDVWGVKLGDSDTVVREKLEKFIKSYLGFNLAQDTNGSPVHGHVAGKMKHQYVLSKDGTYLFFIIGTNDQLETIMFTTIDVRAAC
jgi:hypothetical protein